MKVSVLINSLVVPPPKMNYLMRSFKKGTIGFITQNKNNNQRIQNKIKYWKK